MLSGGSLRPPKVLGTALHELLGPFGGVDLQLLASRADARTADLGVSPPRCIVLDTNLVFRVHGLRSLP